MRKALNEWSLVWYFINFDVWTDLKLLPNVWSQTNWCLVKLQILSISEDLFVIKFYMTNTLNFINVRSSKPPKMLKVLRLALTHNHCNCESFFVVDTLITNWRITNWLNFIHCWRYANANTKISRNTFLN